MLLILAFAQPFLKDKNTAASGTRLQVIYIDNSKSMSVKSGARTLLDIAKEGARRQMEQATEGSVFLVLTNDRPFSYQPVAVEKAVAQLNNIDISSFARSVAQVLATVQGLVQSEETEGADVYYYSDFQDNSFPASSSMQQIHFYGIPVTAKAVANIYIDTAFLTTPVLQSGQNNKLVIKSRVVGDIGKESPILQLSVNGQVKSAVSPAFKTKTESTDTLSFQVNNAGWQQIQLTVNDAAVRFDDTFRITARSASNLSVLVLNEHQPNPFIQAAFHAYNGFRLDQKNTNEKTDWKPYNLIVLNDITRLDDALVKQLTDAMTQGQSVYLLPGRTSDYQSLSDGLNKAAGITIAGLDTGSQAAATLQQASTLVKDIFEHIPDNVQLPVANWHYRFDAALMSNQQSILSFRNGDPFLAQYTPSRGKLYVSATAADLNSGNFTASYFFVPFLYQMTVQARSGDVFAITAGSPEPVYLSLNNTDERNMVHAYAAGLDMIPPQRASGAGADIFLSKVIHQPGFYTLAAKGSDTTIIALNQDKKESRLVFLDINTLKQGWQGTNIHWLNPDREEVVAGAGTGSRFPLWKVCAILAVLMLAAETYLLAAGYRKQTVAPR